MLLELNDIKKSFGKGDSRVEVLRGISLSVEKGEFCVLLAPRDPENPRCSILSAASIRQTAGICILAGRG